MRKWNDVSVGQKRYLAPYHWAIADVKAKLRQHIDDWKKASKANVDSLNVAALVNEFIKNGTSGQRVKTRGRILKYKAKTTKGYREVLTRYVLLQTIIKNIGHTLMITQWIV